jgi:predicted Zn-dependent protease
MRNARLLPLTFALVLFLGNCGSGSNFNLITLEEEWQLGAQLSQDINRQVRLNNDAEVNAYVRKLGQAIVAQTPMRNLPWEFHVINDPAINAFAIPGGHVYVNTGLIAAADNASELAGVMAHEISHGVARHSTEQLTRQQGISVIAQMVLGQNANALATIAAQIAAGGAMARFSREAEREADELGIQYMAAAGYNPRGMASMFQELLDNEKSQPGKVQQFFSTHPLTTQRVKDAENRAAKLGNRGITDEPDYQRIRGRVT